MRVGLIGTGAIAHKHAEAYRRIGFPLVACWNRNAEKGRAFAQKWDCQFDPGYRELCARTDIDFVDVCAFPNFHLEPVQACAHARKPLLLQKPIALDMPAAHAILACAHSAGIPIGVMSQHRFDDATLFLKRALEQNRLGRLLEADAYVKWFRSDDYYARPGKGSWQVEGGGALINQAIHQIDLLLHFLGPVSHLHAMWQLGARHAIESEDVVNALLRFASGATGVVQASTALWPGFTERIEIHGTKGSATISSDRLTLWDVENDQEANALDPAPVTAIGRSGSSDPMAIDTLSFERQFLDFAEAIRTNRPPQVTGEDGLRALDLVTRIYQACRSSQA